MQQGSCYVPQTNSEKPTDTSMQSVPPEKVAEMQAYAVRLRKKWPHMKPDRIQKKVAEHFKVKLV